MNPHKTVIPASIEDAIIYVEPIYIQASAGENNLPEVKKVIVSYQNEIVMADSLNQALGQIFNYDAGEAPAGANTAVSTATPNSSSATSAADLSIRANQLFQEAQNAQKSGDWAGYGSKLNELQDVLNQLQQATGASQPQ